MTSGIMRDELKNALLGLGMPKLVSSFYRDPAVESRPATDEDRKSRPVDRHAHQREVLVVLDGECEILLDRRIYRVFPGCAILVDAGEEHEEYPDVGYFCAILMPEHMVYHLSTSSGDAFRMHPDLGAYRHCDPPRQKMLLDAWRRTRENGAKPEFVTELALLIELLAARLVQVYDAAVAYDEYNPEKRNRIHIRHVMEYIESQCGRDCSIAKLAKLSGCSRTSFIRNFRRHAGCSVLEYVNRQRILRCRSLMKPSCITDQPTPLKECAKELGFSSPQAFARWRKQHFDPVAGGETP